MDLRVLDIVRACNTAEQGEILFNAIWKRLKMEHAVNVSFDGVSEVTSSFINASIVRIVLEKDYSSVEDNLSISDISKPSAEMIRRCLRNAMAHRQE
ncbi:STAS-like domain-containing protein [Pelagerythrobacter aerophilus]